MEAENRYLVFLSKHWSKLVLSVLAVACVAAWSQRLLRKSSDENRHDFVLSQQMFDKFQKGAFLSPESLETVENILERHPELHPKWDAWLALTFLSQADGDKSLLYAQSLLNRSFSELPHPYRDFAETTLLFLEEKYSEAYENALALQQKVAGHEEYKSLDAMNTLRLLFLAEKLGDASQKALAWTKLQKHPAYSLIEPLFQEGALSLADYTTRDAQKT